MWVSFTLHDALAGHTRPVLRGGQPLGAACVDITASCMGVKGVMVNCCTPEVAGAQVTWQTLRSGGAPQVVGCYPNAFQNTTSQWLAATIQGEAADATESAVAAWWQSDSATCDASTHFSSDGIWMPAAFAAWGAALAARETVASNDMEVLLGGCCGTGPPHIAALAAALGQAPSSNRRV
jgi:S-methylmethionine-dependent homocysteine/selenocysteine methylase